MGSIAQRAARKGPGAAGIGRRRAQQGRAVVNIHSAAGHSRSRECQRAGIGDAVTRNTGVGRDRTDCWGRWRTTGNTIPADDIQSREICGRKRRNNTGRAIRIAGIGRIACPIAEVTTRIGIETVEVRLSVIDRKVPGRCA